MPLNQPNILLIVLDTLRRDRLSAYGHHRPTSPELDSFAAQATRFERAIAPAQWTIPAHASLFTGVYPSTHRLTEAHAQLSGLHPTLAEILRGGGYHTVGFCNNPLVGVLDNGLTRGFQDFYNYGGAAPNRPFDMDQNRLRHAFQTRFRRFARPIENRFARSETLFRLFMNPLVVPFWSRLINFKGHTANTITDLIAYWDAHHQGGGQRPLFAFVNLMGAHLPYNPPPDYIERGAPGLRRDRHAQAFMRRFNADAGRWASPPDPALRDWERAALYDFYDAEIAHQDDHLGRLLRHLRKTGALANTLVIICADHGEGHGDHDFLGHGFVVYQELVHVPLIIHYPEQFPPGRCVPTNVSTRRLFHTILEAAGVKPPLDEADPNADIERLTLRRALDPLEDSEGGLAFAEAFPPQTFLSFIKQRHPALVQRLSLSQVRRGVYDGAHKLVMVDQRVEGLFNVADDPAETTSLAGQLPARAAELHQKITAFVKAAEARRTDVATWDQADEAVLDHLRGLGYIE
jgi:uncharacterized sulfatase